MRFYLYTLLLLTFCSKAQESEIISWINQNAHKLEDIGQNEQLLPFKSDVIDPFTKPILFGFGEATHYNKEFFDLKAKFFKYLVLYHGVTVFMMEESYESGYRINEYLAGGKGEAEQLAMRMGFGIWRNQEVADLIRWMKKYNEDKVGEEQLKFFGIDNQFGGLTNKVAKDFILKYEIQVAGGALSILDSAAALTYFKPDRRKIQQFSSVIKEVKEAITKFKPSGVAQYNEQEIALHSLEVLNQFIEFVSKPTTRRRDTDMAANVAWVMDHEGAESKGFIWAHNSHIDIDKDRTPLGYILKQRLGDKYYSVGFEFATGDLYVQEKTAEGIKGKLYNVTEPFADTYAGVFNKATVPNYFFDVKSAMQNPAMQKFLTTSNRSRYGGGSGVYPRSIGQKLTLANVYDGIIFVRKVSHATYYEAVLPEVMRVKS